MRYSKKIAILLITLIFLAFTAGCVNSENPKETETIETIGSNAETGDSANTGSTSLTEASSGKKNETGEAADTQSSAIVITDMTGREVKLDAPAERIVVLDASDCEILYAIDAGDKVVGRGEYCNYPEEVNAVPSVQSGSETNIEQIIALEPQIVLMTKMGQAVEQVEALENAGIRVFASDSQKIEDVYTAIELIGTITGKNEKAAAVVSDMKKSFSDIKSKVKDGDRKTVYFEVSPLEWGLWTAAKGTFMDELSDMLGLDNIFSDVSGWAEVSQEQVIERNPDIIVTIAMYFGEGATPVEEIMSRSGWENITAVKNGDVLNADQNEISLPGPRLVDGAASLYEFVYGGGKQ
ncbi:MAG: ABC transporter substrate-binding protein [Ruminiclostridium sp.]|nr:ABC transporter substrate-binding protein [Ruminiclostridium sp.]